MPDTFLTPDLIFTNGKVLTVDADDTVAEAVAVGFGRILAVGAADDVLALRGRRTEVIDLEGRTLMPGLTDPHVHLADNGTAEQHKLDCRDFYTNVRALSDMTAKIGEEARSRPEGEWIIAHGSPMQDDRMPEKRYPNRWDLDEVAPRHPVAINFGAHLTVVNSLGLERAGITKETTPPDGGGIALDPASGEPTGMIQERAQQIVRNCFPVYGFEELKDAIVFSARQCVAKGITTVHDIVVDNRTVRAYQELADEGRLPLRVSLLIRVIESKIVPESLLNLGLYTGFGNDWLRIGGVKMSIDGGLTGRLARFSEPYEGEPCNCGLIRIPVEELEHTVDAYHRAGHRVCIHAMGDVAMDMALDALDKSITAQPRADHRHRIEHMGNNMCTADRIERMVRLGLLPIPNVSFLHHVGEALIACLGERRMEKSFNFRMLLDAGIPLTTGSDAPGYWPVDVLRDLGSCVSRRTWQGATLGPDEAVSLREAIRMATINAAYAGFAEKTAGSLEPGKLADLAVLAEDIHDVPADRIKDIPVDFTVVDGKIAHARAAA